MDHSIKKMYQYCSQWANAFEKRDFQEKEPDFVSVQTTDIQDPQPLTQRSPWWAIALAVLITVSINAIIPYTHHYMHTISLVEGMIPMGILMPFLVLIFIVNPALRALGCALQPWELIFIFAVGYVSMSINELLGRVLATYAVMHYMATPENLWEEYVFGLVQPYLVVEDAKDQLAWFYEGLPRNATIP